MTYVMSDLHGMYDLYWKMLKKISFSDSDVLYILGDFADRGMYGLDIILDVAKRKNVIGILGNHDKMAREFLNAIGDNLDFDDISDAEVDDDAKMTWYLWMLNGGAVTLDMYKELSEEERAKVLDMLNNLKKYEVVHAGGCEFVLCHAGIGNYEEGKDLSEYTLSDLTEKREDYSRPKFAKEGKYLVTGHTPTLRNPGATKGKIYRNHDHIAIDCGAVFGYGLGCLCLDTLEEFYVE